jgi:hypothetical protein
VKDDEIGEARCSSWEDKNCRQNSDWKITEEEGGLVERKVQV